MRLVLALAVPLVILACDSFDAESMFITHASQFERGELKNVRGGKVACMHCPLYFSFDAEPALIGKVVAKQRLQPSTSPPPQAREIEKLVQREANWWQVAGPSNQDRIYWVSYKPKEPGSEPAFRYLVLKGERAFFITSGSFSPANYEASSP